MSPVGQGRVKFAQREKVRAGEPIRDLARLLQVIHVPRDLLYARL